MALTDPGARPALAVEQPNDKIMATLIWRNMWLLQLSRPDSSPISQAPKSGNKRNPVWQLFPHSASHPAAPSTRNVHVFLDGNSEQCGQRRHGAADSVLQQHTAVSQRCQGGASAIRQPNGAARCSVEVERSHWSSALQTIQGEGLRWVFGKINTHRWPNAVVPRSQNRLHVASAIEAVPAVQRCISACRRALHAAMPLTALGPSRFSSSQLGEHQRPFTCSRANTSQNDELSRAGSS